ncbi:MAG: ABC transporter permease [Candidatus Atribacteria bacterium]|nr:ABC transporter permease [Candidatus Atribacteria bacterium]
MSTRRTTLVVREAVNKAYFKPVLFLAVALVLATAISPHFLTIRNIRAILISASPLMIVAVGEAIVVLTGMIDLGCESVLASSGVLIATMDLMLRFPTFISFTLTLAFGLLIGVLNGLLVVRARIPSFVTTLGMYWGLRGLAMVISQGYPISPSAVSSSVSFSFQWIVSNFRGIPVMVIIAFAVAIFAQIFISEFKKGREIYAVGGNELAARNCGVNVDLVKIQVFMVSGFLSALAGIIMTAWINQAYAWTAQGFSLQAVAAVVLGGIPFIGGFGTVIGVVIGSFIIAMISDLIVLLGVSPLYSYIVTAVVLVVAGLQVQKGKFVK